MTIVPPTIAEDDVLAVRAVLEGVANPQQQIRCMQWIGTEACQMFTPSYQDGEKPLATAHAEGRRYAGILIMQMRDEKTLATARRKRAT